MATVRHIAILAGQMGADEYEVHPDALAAAAEALTTGVLRLPDGSEARVSRQNEGHWFRTDWQGNHTLSAVHRGTEDETWTLELIALGMQYGGHLSAVALSSALQMTPIVVTVVEHPDGMSSQLCDIASWVGLAILRE